MVLLAAGSLTPIEIDVEARSNGRFPVTVQVVTPDGGVALTDPIVFTARVNALAGLGQVVTGVALLLLATWWVHHCAANTAASRPKSWPARSDTPVAITRAEQEERSNRGWSPPVLLSRDLFRSWCPHHHRQCLRPAQRLVEQLGIRIVPLLHPLR